MNFIDVIVPLPLKNSFTYLVNEEEFKFIDIGFRVMVPFGKSKFITGIVSKKHKNSPERYLPKEIEFIIDSSPIITENQLVFYTWISDYYLCPIGQVIKVALPKLLLLKSESEIFLTDKIIEDNSLSVNAKKIIQFLDQKKKISLKDFSIDIGIDENKVNKVLSELKKFEPIGVFSQSLEESFLLQLEDRKLLNNSIKNLINNLEILASGDLKKLIKICDTDESGIFKMLKIIRSCNPKPLSSFDENDYDDIKEPDVIVKKVKSKWIVELNENTLPKVLVNSGYYEELASKNLTKEDKDYLATRYASGKWLLKALEQRSATILRVSREIIRQQNSFLEAGLAYIKPMILKDIAKELDLHESTISRITNSKEIDTPRGIYSLKFFFSKAIASNGNEDISSQSVKTKIRNFIDNETVKTLSDTKLRDLLHEYGIRIARRTITKYREEMNIPSSFERKKIKKLKI